jgi:hypothetical protein
LKATLLIGGKSDEHERHDEDFYPTPKECTHALMQFLMIDPHKSIQEPACGDGMMSKVLEGYSTRVLSTDLRVDSGYGLGGANFLLQNEKFTDYCITNPPFDLASEFIKKCSQLGYDIYAMLLKSTYWHSSKRNVLFNKTKPSYIMPLTWRPNFAPDRGSAPTMDMIWTVWIKGQHEASYIPLLKATKIKQNKLF